MSDTEEVLDPAAEPEGPPAPREKAAPIFNRFLYVDVAAMRAKQLRRGALPRLDDDDEMHDVQRPDPHKAERVAMEEVRRGLVLYEVPAVLKPGEVRGEPPPR
jgi:DNA-directed RNA polymerase subunit K/omega